MASQVELLCEAVASELNGNSFSQEFTAKAIMFPQITYEEISELTVIVTPYGGYYNRETRSSFREDLAISVVVVNRQEGASEAFVKSMLTLVEEIKDALKIARLESLPSAWLFKVENAPMFDRELLNEMHQFSSDLALTYSLVR